MHSSVRGTLLAALLIAGVATAGRSVQAGDEDGVAAVRGVGVITCAQYVQMLEAERPDLRMVAGWVDGFVTGLNAATPNVFDHLPWQATDLVLQLLGNHCAANPNEVLAGALARFIQMTRETRLASSSDVVDIPVPDGQGPLQIYKATLAQAQQLLAELGHYGSTVDGAYGPGTAAALKAFQAQAGLPENGLPDQRTLLVLFSSTFEGAN